MVANTHGGSATQTTEIEFGADRDQIERELVGLIGEVAELGREHTVAIINYEQRLQRIERHLGLPAMA